MSKWKIDWAEHERQWAGFDRWYVNWQHRQRYDFGEALRIWTFFGYGPPPINFLIGPRLKNKHFFSSRGARDKDANYIRLLYENGVLSRGLEAR
jgi:hypothetical protein